MPFDQSLVPWIIAAVLLVALIVVAVVLRARATRALAAARGQAAVVGEHVVFDRIATEPDFRRRGLGSRVMAGLEHGAADRGATTGLLFASIDGRRLYERLGWREVAELGTWRGRGLQG